MTISAAREDDDTVAAAWVARLQRDDAGEADGLEFDAWLASGPGNEAAYRRALEVWHDFGAASGAVLEELGARGRRTALRNRPLATRRWLIGGGGMAIAAGLAVTLLPGVAMQPNLQTFVTGKGERRKATLADGSTIDFNAETRLSISLSSRERRVRLGDGEAIFDVAHDERRPFIVEAGDRTVRVLGTQFDVRHRDGEVTVTVARGSVQVRPDGSNASRAYVLTPGQRLTIPVTGAEQLRAVDPQETFSWRAGRLVYRGESLATVVADLNRQFPQQIAVEDAELAQIPITGVIVLDNPSAIMARLSLMLPIRTVPSERGLLLLRR